MSLNVTSDCCHCHSPTIYKEEEEDEEEEEEKKEDKEEEEQLT